MSKTVDSFYILYNNPFLLSSILVEFYKNYNSNQKRDLLLSYLVLPITLYDKSKEGLQRANKQRTIRTFVKESDRLFGLAERISEFKKLTNLSLQFAADQQLLNIDNNLSVSVNEMNLPTANSNIKIYLTASANLAKMLNGADIVSVYRQLGIKNI